MTPEARLAFLLFFFTVWCFLGLFAWCIGAIFARGRGALPALPMALAAACAFGVAVPIIGLDNAPGFFLSLAAAFLGGAIGAIVGIALALRLWPARKPDSHISHAGSSGADDEGATTSDIPSSDPL
jgi:hypothetical protein